jgi:hypothetical protein
VILGVFFIWSANAFSISALPLTVPNAVAEHGDHSAARYSLSSGNRSASTSPMPRLRATPSATAFVSPVSKMLRSRISASAATARLALGFRAHGIGDGNRAEQPAVASDKDLRCRFDPDRLNQPSVQVFRRFASFDSVTGAPKSQHSADVCVRLGRARRWRLRQPESTVD